LGIKPTYGAVSRHGLVACASSLAQIGPIAKNIDDCAALLSIISGADNKDDTCVLEKPFEFESAGKLDGVKIGLPEIYLQGTLCEDIKNAILAAAKELEAAGATVVKIANMDEFKMPSIDYIVPAYYAIAAAESSSNLSRYDGLKFGYRNTEAKSLSDVYRLSRSEGFGLEVKKRIMLGSFVLSSGNYDAYYRKALQIRTLVKNAYDNLFNQFDFILSPVTPTTAFKLGAAVDNPHVYTASVNLAGLPAAALPCGFDKQGLPIGLQLVGSAFSDIKLVEIAQVYQNRTKHHLLFKDLKSQSACSITEET
jgi:aspartyl-tRNA(Asn)/glutamyl-tRNA(Gln) amidotransferase subunit A